jgi:hypothetical protein
MPHPHGTPMTTPTSSMHGRSPAPTAATARMERLAGLVSRTRSGVLAAILATGLLLVLLAAVAWLIGGVLLDLAAPLPVGGRIAVLAGWWCVVAAAAALFVLAPALRRPSIDAVALRIERALGGMHNRLLTVIDLARRLRGQTGTQAAAAGYLDADGHTLRTGLVERLVTQTDERLRGFRGGRVVPWRAVGRATAWVAAGIGVVVLLIATLGERFSVTLERLRHPTADIPPATWLQLRSPGDLSVLVGEPFVIEAHVDRGATDDVSLVVIDAAGRHVRSPMSRVGPDTFSASLDGLTEPVRYRLEGGGTWTRTHAVAVVPRPEIVAVRREIRLPDYMRIDAPLPVAPEQRRIEAVEGSSVEFTALTSSEAATGAILLFERGFTDEVVERFDERVWFEDDLPRDAVAEPPWRWTTAEAAGGLRSFTFGTTGRSLSMRTRLEPLVLPKDRLTERSLMVMALPDAAAPPTWLTLLLEYDGGRTEIVWGDDAAAPRAERTHRHAAGPLPPAGSWTRLVAPLHDLGHLAGRSVTAATFAIDAGRIHLDRPGWVERREEIERRPVDRPAGTIGMARDDDAGPAMPQTDPHPVDGSHAAPHPHHAASTGTWRGSVPVQRPLRAALEFLSARGHANLPDPPVDIAPTVDRPPAIVVSGVPETLTLSKADDVPLTGGAFDDWGLDRIDIRVGTDPRTLGSPQPLAGIALADRPPDTHMPLPPTITAEQLGLEAGVSVAWQLVVVDTKGQMAESPIFRVVVMAPPETDLARSQTPALAKARQAAERLARDAERAADALHAQRADAERAVEATAAKPKAAISEAKRAIDAQTPEARDRAAAAEQAARDALESLTPQEQAKVKEAQKALEKQRAAADAVAQQVKEAATQADESRLVPDAQAARLAELAADARALEQSLAADARLPEQAAQLERLAEAARPEAVAEAAQNLAEALADVERQLDAAGAGMQIAALSRDLERRAEQLGDLARSAPPPQPPTMPASAEDAAAQQADATRDPAASQAPTEADRPSSSAAPSPADAARDAAAREAAREAIRELEQILGRDVAAERTATAEDAAMAAEAAAETGRRAAELAAALAGGSPPQAPDGDSFVRPAADAEGKADAQGKADGPSTDAEPPAQPGGKPGAQGRPQPGAEPTSQAAAGSSPPSADETAAPGPTVDDAEVRDALAMAQRARRLEARAAREAARDAQRQQAAARQQGEATDQAGTEPSPQAAAEPDGRPSDGGAMSGRTALVDPLVGLGAAERAAVEALPPRVRQSLLDGMRQQGPEAYRPAIEAYFRALGRELPQ